MDCLALLFHNVDLVGLVAQFALVLLDEILGYGLIELSHFLESILRLVHSCIDILALLGVGGHVSRKHIVVPGELVGMLTPLFDRLVYYNDENKAIKCRVLDLQGLTWNFEALLIVEYVDDTLVTHHRDRRRKELGLLVAQVDAVWQAVFMEYLTRPIRGAKRVHRVDTVVSIPAWEGPHEQLVHEATAGDGVVRCNLFETEFVVSAIMYH